MNDVLVVVVDHKVERIYSQIVLPVGDVELVFIHVVSDQLIFNSVRHEPLIGPLQLCQRVLLLVALDGIFKCKRSAHCEF